MDSTSRWKLTESDNDTEDAPLRFPTGGVFAAGGKTPPLDTHDGVEREILASLEGMKADIDDINAMIAEAIPFPGGFFNPDDNRPTAA